MRRRQALWIAALPFVVVSCASRAAVQSPASNHDLTAIWIGPYTPNLERGMSLACQPGAEERLRNHRGEDDPTTVCLPPGAPRALGSPFPIEFLQAASSATVLYEYMPLVRRIPTDGRNHPTDPDPTFMGDS